MSHSKQAFIEQFSRKPGITGLKFVHKAVLTKRGKIIAEAGNKIGSRSRGSGYSDYSIHAERNVVKALGDLSLLRGADIYIMRLRNTPTEETPFLNSKPCPSCKMFLDKCIREYGLRNVYYTE